MDGSLKDGGLKFIKVIKTVYISFELYLINVFHGNAIYFLIRLLCFHVEVLGFFLIFKDSVGSN